MANRQIIVTQKELDRIKAKMINAISSVKPRKVGLQSVVNSLCREISASLGKGYSYGEISEKFTKEGVKISTATLSTYHRRAVLAGFNSVAQQKIREKQQKST